MPYAVRRETLRNWRENGFLEGILLWSNCLIDVIRVTLKLYVPFSEEFLFVYKLCAATVSPSICHLNAELHNCTCVVCSETLDVEVTLSQRLHAWYFWTTLIFTTFINAATFTKASCSIRIYELPFSAERFVCLCTSSVHLCLPPRSRELKFHGPVDNVTTLYPLCIVAWTISYILNHDQASGN